MNHSLLRNKDEVVKLFSHKNPSRVQKTLKVYTFTEVGLTNVTPSFTVQDLSTGYYSTEITTPDYDCYLLILYCGNPIILRVGRPPIQFFYWSTDDNVLESYKHFNEHGDLVSSGYLKQLNYGFSYYTPVEETLGYIEVRNRPIILDIPYSVDFAGVGINVDWRRTIIRQEFGVKTSKLQFKLNTIKNHFDVKKIKKVFILKEKYNKFNIKTVKQKFKVTCKG